MGNPKEVNVRPHPRRWPRSSERKPGTLLRVSDKFVTVKRGELMFVKDIDKAEAFFPAEAELLTELYRGQGRNVVTYVVRA